jgi:hypothetical protein
LWSKHVDIKKGDRKATCQAGMQPIGLTFKHEGYDRVGEIMLVHRCSDCTRISINRIAGDDATSEILAIYDASITKGGRDSRLASQGITLMSTADRAELQTQLFGK